MHTQIQRKNLLDIYKLSFGSVGIYRETFDRVMELDGFELRPASETSEIWEFHNSNSAQRGRLLNVEGFLSDAPVALNTKGRAYMITRQEFTLALMLPGRPRRIHLNETRYKVLDPTTSKRPMIPPHWPEGSVSKVIRLRLTRILILDEGFMLRQIGLRGTL